MVGSKIQKLVLEGQGSYLGMEKGCFIVKDRNGKTERYPLFEKEIGEVILKSGNMVSTGALASLGFWDIDVMILTQRGRPVAMLKSLEDDFTVKAESVSRKRKGKREYLNDLETRDFMKQLYRYFEAKVEVSRIRVGKRQTIETLINEEALLFAKFLRDERETWVPRINSNSRSNRSTNLRVR